MNISQLISGKKIVIASNNHRKLLELSILLSPYKFLTIPIKNYYAEDLAEDGNSFEDNARQKAQFANELTGLPALADDSGFCVTMLQGCPGIHSARWAGPKKDFVHAMQQIHDKIRQECASCTSTIKLNLDHIDLADGVDAYFVCVLALVQHQNVVTTFRGEVHGNLIWPPRGDNGFGYDSMFVPIGNNLSFGEMLSDDKEKINHRFKAFSLFRDYLECIEN